MPGLGLSSGHPLRASGRDTTAERGTGAAALSTDGGQLAAAQQAQRLTEIEGQAIPLTTWKGKRGEEMRGVIRIGGRGLQNQALSLSDSTEKPLALLP